MDGHEGRRRGHQGVGVGRAGHVLAEGDDRQQADGADEEHAASRVREARKPTAPVRLTRRVDRVQGDGGADAGQAGR